MTVKMNNRRIFSLSVLLFIIFITGSIFAQKKNILHIHFETATVKTNTTDIVLKVFYTLEAPKPVSFRGFDCRFIYENTKIQPVTSFFDGTACEFADNAHGTYVPPDEYRVQVLSGSMLDTSNHVLFEVRYSIKGFTDSAMISPTLFLPIDDDGMRIDTVLIDNSPGRDQLSWYPFGLMFADTTKTPPPPNKKSIALLNDSTDILSDSIKFISLNVSSLDSANVKNGIFEFDIDTSAFDSVAVTKGALLLNGILSLSRDTTHVTAKFSNADTSKAFATAGELLKIILRGKKIADTICTGFLNPKFTVLNGDNLVASITYKLQSICVLGKPKKDTVVGGVAQSDIDRTVTILPNPGNTYIIFHAPNGGTLKRHLVIFDALGKQVLDTIFDSDLHWEVASVSAGFYTATVTSFSALQVSEKTETSKILIIH